MHEIDSMQCVCFANQSLRDNWSLVECVPGDLEVSMTEERYALSHNIRSVARSH